MKNIKSIRTLTVTAIMSALGFVLMLLEFPLPMLIPSFIKFDFSELPAIITSFALGPVYGVAVCFFKNLLHLFVTTTGGVGELSNFLLGAIFVFIAGSVYKKNKTFKRAIIGTILGAVVMSVISIFTNYYITYPFYQKFMPLDLIISAYADLLPIVDNLWEALIIFNLPFNLFKGIIDSLICFLCYKKLSPIIKGNK